MANAPKLTNPYSSANYEGKTGSYTGDVYNSKGWNSFRHGDERRANDVSQWQDEITWQNEYDWNMFMLDYNSEQSKAQRMRAAGQNPDLLGLESASEASEFNEPMPSSRQTSQQNERINTISGMCLSALAAGQQFVSTLQGYRYQDLQSAALETEILNNAFGYGEKLGGSFNFKALPIDSQNSFLETIAKNSTGIKSRRFRSAYVQALESAVSGMQASNTFWDAKTGTWRHKNESIREAATYNAYHRNDPEAGLESEYSDVAQIVADYLIDTSTKKAKGDKKAAENYATYQENLKPVSAASAVNAGNEAVANQRELQETATGLPNELIKKLDKYGDEHDSTLAKIVAAFLATGVLRLQTAHFTAGSDDFRLNL